MGVRAFFKQVIVDETQMFISVAAASLFNDKLA